MAVQKITSYDNALDGRRLEKLRYELRNPTPESLRTVAKQFESLFVQSLLKSMRAATPGGSLFSGHGVKQYRSLLDQQLASSIAQGRGIGLAAMLERQLLSQNAPSKAAAVESTKHSLTGYRNRPPAAPAPVESPAAAKPATTSQAAPWGSPESFVRSIWPAAQRTAHTLGVPPEALVAQAALETGWGEHVLRHADGRSSFNLFNIKAHGGWTGDTVRIATLEYRDGVARRESAAFRAYGSVAEAFADYADFLRHQPRYAEALDSGGDALTFLQSLQRAGYATDPAYADKIRRVMDSPTLRPGRAELKKMADGTKT
ncbi:flagellar assembly peptidoglycan hydrolase FlgJ [Nitrococcus mobilis]|uniref:Peptidoglycan hydrolase FlgJ n=1 Tax=Nitrococcus mobilis Nb-231 TaxID=314278 RepID=A4BVN3_9GAMM|nr:flagellar assembly peptidoglycan hydrolase FlgJ [Nitrococcus mobilis]EAR20215.1 Mannosyl-glycoprotein endo-beta-N-acetylglucosamidase [Nitrococcus mobilis Nb-231]